MKTYHTAHIYHKTGNLLPWLESRYPNATDRQREYYAQERDIELILLVRHENGRTLCRIKCPVNPLPVRGEFEVPVLDVRSWLNHNGWLYKQTIHIDMFNA